MSLCKLLRETNVTDYCPDGISFKGPTYSIVNEVRNILFLKLTCLFELAHHIFNV